MCPVFDGIPALFDAALGLAGNERYGVRPDTPQYKSRQAAIDLSNNGGPIGGGAIDAVGLSKQAMGTLAQNVAAANGTLAASNWEWKKSLHLACHNESPEKTLEKLAAFLLCDDWVNQVPICNGLARGGRANAARIDLVHRVAKTSYDLIELKFGLNQLAGSDHPLYAAMEVVQYGLMYLLMRKCGWRAASPRHHMMQAERITLVVLGPADWYRFKRRANSFPGDFDFGWLASALSEGLQAYADETNLGLTIKLEFRQLNTGFHANYLSLLGHIQAFRDNGNALAGP